MTPIERLKERYSILDMVDKLKLGDGRRGAKILCPFHDDTSPSCHLYVDDDRFRCFTAGCEEGGDQLDLWAKVTGRPIIELAGEEGVEWKVEPLPRKPKPPAPAELLGRVAAKAHLEVLQALARDNPEARGQDGWVPLVTAAFQPYDELLRRYRNTELFPEDTTELILIWWRWQIGQEPYGSDLRRLWTVLGDPRADADPGPPTPERNPYLDPIAGGTPDPGTHPGGPPGTPPSKIPTRRSLAPRVDVYALPYFHESGDEHRHEGVTDIHPHTGPHTHPEPSVEGSGPAEPIRSRRSLAPRRT